MSDKIVIDLTENIANAGKRLLFCGKYAMDNDLLSYPNANLLEVVVEFSVVFENPNVRVFGNIGCLIEGNCDRCLDRVEKLIDLPFDQTFYKDSAEDADSYVYSNSKLDATKAVRDEIVLSLPSAFLCKDGCKGLCPKCGANLNEQQCDCDTSKDNPFSVLKNLKF